jgi:hypothetical protein
MGDSIPEQNDSITGGDQGKTARLRTQPASRPATNCTLKAARKSEGKALNAAGDVENAFRKQAQQRAHLVELKKAVRWAPFVFSIVLRPALEAGRFASGPAGGSEPINAKHPVICRRDAVLYTTR